MLGGGSLRKSISRGCNYLHYTFGMSAFASIGVQTSESPAKGQFRFFCVKSKPFGRENSTFLLQNEHEPLRKNARRYHQM